MTEYINLELSGNDKGDDQLTKRPYIPKLLLILPLLLLKLPLLW